VPPIQYLVEGGHRLAGTIKPSGNKNAALPIIAAALLTEHPVTLNNLPRIRDTENAGGADPLGRRCGRMAEKAIRLRSTPRPFVPAR
jgi:UDP-N-acetylglucosamine 1-carboxyvinyltransferase